MLNTAFALLASFQTPAPATAPPALQLGAPHVLSYYHTVALASAQGRGILLVSLEDRSVRVVNAANGQELTKLPPHPGPVYGLAFSPDGRYVATGDETGRVDLWTTSNWQRIFEWRLHTRGIEKLDFSSDSKVLLSTGKDDSLIMYDLESRTLKPQYKILGKGANVYGAEFVPGRKAALTGVLKEGARLYAPDGRVLLDLVGHAGLGVLDIDVSQSAVWAATGGRDNVAIVWNAKNGQPWQGFRGHTDWVGTVRFSPNGKFLATGSVDRTVKVWDIAKKQLVTTLENQSAVGSPLAWTGDGKYLATVGVDDALMIYPVTPTQEFVAEKPSKRTRKKH